MVGTLANNETVFSLQKGQNPFGIARVEESKPAYMPALSSNVTTISRNTVIRGAITTDAELVVDGTIEGDVQAGAVEVGGQVKGNIKCDSAELIHARVQGAVIATGDVTVGEDSALLGDVTAKNVTVDGAVKGKISSTGIVRFGSNAKHVGNISTSNIMVAMNSSFNGEIRTSSSIDMEEFDNV